MCSHEIASLSVVGLGLAHCSCLWSANYLSLLRAACLSSIQLDDKLWWCRLGLFLWRRRRGQIGWIAWRKCDRFCPEEISACQKPCGAAGINPATTLGQHREGHMESGCGHAEQGATQNSWEWALG